jgi:hypothetical protein
MVSGGRKREEERMVRGRKGGKRKKENERDRGKGTRVQFWVVGKR